MLEMKLRPAIQLHAYRVASKKPMWSDLGHHVCGRGSFQPVLGSWECGGSLVDPTPVVGTGLCTGPRGPVMELASKSSEIKWGGMTLLLQGISLALLEWMIKKQVICKLWNSSLL